MPLSSSRDAPGSKKNVSDDTSAGAGMSITMRPGSIATNSLSTGRPGTTTPKKSFTGSPIACGDEGNAMRSSPPSSRSSSIPRGSVCENGLPHKKHSNPMSSQTGGIASPVAATPLPAALAFTETAADVARRSGAGQGPPFKCGIPCIDWVRGAEGVMVWVEGVESEG